MPPNLPDAPVGDGIDADAFPASPPEAGPDADGGSDADGGTDADGDGGSDGTDADGGEVNCHTNRIEPPIMACTNNHCLQLSGAMRAGAALWLDPSNLGPPGTEVAIWCDQSGNKNEAIGINDDFPPLATRGGGVSLASTEDGAGFGVYDSPSLNLAADDFTLLVVAGINLSGPGRVFFSKRGGDPLFPKQVVLDSLPVGQGYQARGRVNETDISYDATTLPGPDRLYVLRRVGNQIQVRVNGALMMSSIALSTAGASTANDGDVYLGIGGYLDPVSVDTLRTVILIHASLSEEEVGSLESYLLTAFNL